MKTTDLDYVIVGAGPAGLQLGYYLKMQGRRAVILEKANRPGSFFETLPRHRKLISINKLHTGYDDSEINLRWDWNSLLEESERPLRFTDYSKRYFPPAEDLLRYLSDFAQRHDLPMLFGRRVESISRPDRYLVRTTAGEEFRAAAVIIATGVSKSNLPDIPGLEHAAPYAVAALEPERYCGRRVLVIGKGNSAFETADSLVETAAVIHLVSPNPLKMAWSTHFVGHLRAINNNILDTYQLKSQNAILDANVQSIERRGDKLIVRFSYAHAEGETEEICYDDVIACTGFRFDASIFAPDCAPQLTLADRFPAMTAGWRAVNLPDVYFAGTLMQSRDYKQYTSGFIHGFRYNVRCLSRLLEETYFGAPYPSRHEPLEACGLAAAMLARINRTSALWQQPGFLCDCFDLARSDQRALVEEELPVDLAIERMVGTGRNYLLLTLEFGSRKFDYPFSVDRIARDHADRAAASNFLHPVVRLYRGYSAVAEHHVIEDLAAEWKEPEHIEPLECFLREVIETLESSGRNIEEGAEACL